MPTSASPLQPSLGMPGLGSGSGPLDRLSIHSLGSVPLSQHGTSLPATGISPAHPALAGSQGSIGIGDGPDGLDDVPPMKRAKPSFGGASIGHGEFFRRI